MRAAWILGCTLLISISLFAQGGASSSESRGSSPDFNPIRSSQHHEESDGRSTDKESLERLGPDGRYIPYLDTERESVRLNSTTVRETERTYARDADGRKTLTQVVEQVKSTLPGGIEKVVTNTSTPDADGRLHLIKQDLEDTHPAGANATETKRTSYTPGPDGQLIPSFRTDERRTRSGDHDIQIHQSILWPDLNGNWQLQEVHDGVINAEGPKQTRDEKILRPDNDGRMSVVERNVTVDDTAQGRQTAEHYSTTMPGSAEAGRLRLDGRSTTVRRNTLAGGTVTERQTSQRNPGDPNADPRPTAKTIDIVTPASSGGTQIQRQTISIDTNGNTNVVWIDTGAASAAVKVDTNQGEAKKPQVPSKPQ